METWKLLHCIDGWQWGLSRYPLQSPSLSSFAAISCLVCGWLSLPFFLSQFYLATWYYQVTLPRNLSTWLNQVSQVPPSRTRYIRYHRCTVNFCWVDSYWFDHLLRVFVEKTIVSFLCLFEITIMFQMTDILNLCCFTLYLKFLFGCFYAVIQFFPATIRMSLQYCLW